MQKPQRILEVGCAIGYSSILFATTCEDNVDITTCERNPVMIERAKENIKRAGFENNIRILEGDAVEQLKNVEGEFDMGSLMKIKQALESESCRKQDGARYES